MFAFGVQIFVYFCAFVYIRCDGPCVIFRSSCSSISVAETLQATLNFSIDNVCRPAPPRVYYTAVMDINLVGLEKLICMITHSSDGSCNSTKPMCTCEPQSQQYTAKTVIIRPWDQNWLLTGVLWDGQTIQEQDVTIDEQSCPRRDSTTTEVSTSLETRETRIGHRSGQEQQDEVSRRASLKVVVVLSVSAVPVSILLIFLLFTCKMHRSVKNIKESVSLKLSGYDQPTPPPSLSADMYHGSNVSLMITNEIYGEVTGDTAALMTPRAGIPLPHTPDDITGE